MNTSYSPVPAYDGAGNTFQVFQPHRATTSMLRVDSLAERKAQRLFVSPYLKRNNLSPSHVLLDFVAVKPIDHDQRDGSMYTFQLFKWNPSK